MLQCHLLLAEPVMAVLGGDAWLHGGDLGEDALTLALDELHHLRVIRCCLEHVVDEVVHGIGQLGGHIDLRGGDLFVSRALDEVLECCDVMIDLIVHRFVLARRGHACFFDHFQELVVVLEGCLLGPGDPVGHLRSDDTHLRTLGSGLRSESLFLTLIDHL